MRESELYTKCVDHVCLRARYFGDRWVKARLVLIGRKIHVAWAGGKVEKHTLIRISAPPDFDHFPAMVHAVLTRRGMKTLEIVPFGPQELEDDGEGRERG